MRTRSLLALAVASVVAAACGPDERSQTSQLGPLDTPALPPADLDRVAVGDTAPDFRLAALGADPIRLSDLRQSQDVVLVFYRGHW
jgi:hypothetical protein